MLDEIPNSASSPAAPSPGSSLAPGLSDYNALKAANVNQAASMARVQSQAISRVNELVNGLVELGIQFPFLQEQVSTLAEFGEFAKQQILINLGPMVNAEAAQGSQNLSQAQQVSSIPSSQLGLGDVPGMEQ